jgi:hypothetical protein
MLLPKHGKYVELELEHEVVLPLKHAVETVLEL